MKSENDLPEDSTWKVVTYERTPIMSTYLLAFVVGEYDYVEDKDSDGVLVRVYTPVGKKEQGQFALEVAVKTLPFYNKYFQIAYPLPKIDLIAIADFAAGFLSFIAHIYEKSIFFQVWQNYWIYSENEIVRITIASDTKS